MKTSASLSSLVLLLLLPALVMIGCKRDDCKPGEDCNTQETELITKLSVVLSDAQTGAAIGTFDFEDADGAGGNNPTIDSIALDSNTTYNAAIRVYATANSSQTEITPEILAEDHEHLFCFSYAGTGLTVTRTDSDGTYQVGLQSSWVTTSGNGTLTITLRHQPDAKDGTCTPGDTDVEVAFPVQIQ